MGLIRRRPLIAVVLLALVVRAALVAATPDYLPFGDAADYDRHAASIAAGAGYPPTQFAAPGSPSAFRPPAYPYALGTVYAVTGARWTAGRLFGVLLGSAAVALLYAIAAAVWDRRTAVVAGTLAAVFPPLVALSGTLLSEALFVVLELGVVASVLAYRRAARAWPWALVAGALCGAAALTRSSGLLLVLPAALGVWTARPRFAPRSLLAPAGVAAAAVLVVAPWTIRNADAFGRFVPVTTQVGYTIAGTYNSEARADGPTQAASRVTRGLPEFADVFAARDLDEAEIDRELRPRAKEFVLDHPGYVLEAVRLNVLRMLDRANDPAFDSLWDQELAIPRRLRGATTASFYLVLLLALAVLAAAAAGRLSRPVGPFWLWLVPLLAFLSVIPLSGKPRYRAPIDPFLVLLAALALTAAYELWLAARPDRRPSRRDPASARS